MRKRFTFCELAGLGLAMGGLVHGASIPEPETVIYGKVTNYGGAVPYQVTEGRLTWGVGEGEGVRVFATDLRPLDDGTYSYSLSVPHEALSLGLEVNVGVVPLGVGEVEHRHTGITVDGRVARIASPGGYRMAVGQALRARTYRLDLEISAPVADSDGDGMADWWEEAHGFDVQLGDGAGDADGDGVSNLNEYLAGTDPAVDNRVPQLRTGEVVVYSGATTGVVLETSDSDTAAGGLRYTLGTVPGVGTLVLRGEGAEVVLGAGDAFAQADVNGGRVVFRHEEGDAIDDLKFEVTVDDGGVEPGVATGEIAVRVFEAALPDGGDVDVLADLAVAGLVLPGVLEEEQGRVSRALLGRERGFLVWDFSGTAGRHVVAMPSSAEDPVSYLERYVSEFGTAPRVVIEGGPQDDVLTGGMEADLISGGAGDDTLTGSGGADRFVVRSAGDGNDTVTDFRREEGDVLDLSRVLDGASERLRDYVRVAVAGEDALLGIDADGDGSGFSDVVVTLRDVGLGDDGLRELYDGGALATGRAVLLPQVSVSAPLAEARENGSAAGAFEIVRSGSVEEALEVHFSVAGSAGNGVDYSLVQSPVTIPAGQRTLRVAITPTADAVSEPSEVVELVLGASGGYELAGSGVSAQVSIRDLMPELTLEALEPLAVVDGARAGVFLLRRNGLVEQSLLVRLEVGGTAQAGRDFERVVTFLTLARGETHALIEVRPLAGAAVVDGARSVSLAVREDGAYLMGGSGSARVTIIERETTLAEWREEHFPDDGSELGEFAGSAGEGGVAPLVRYGFGLGARGGAMAEVLPRMVWVDGHAGIEFMAMPEATDLRYVVEMSSGLGDWEDAGERVERAGGNGDDDARRVVYRVKQPPGEAGEMFLRVRVRYEP